MRRTSSGENTHQMQPAEIRGNIQQAGKMPGGGGERQLLAGAIDAPLAAQIGGEMSLGEEIGQRRLGDQARLVVQLSPAR